jgi:N-acetylmuramoyl-L-alanine amidase
VDFYFENKLYKYTVGSDSDYNKIKTLQKEIRQKFSDAFVIAFVGDKKLTEKDALNLLKK